MASHERQHELSWRVPSDRDAPAIGTRVLRILFAGAVCLVALWLLAADRVWWSGLAVLVPLAAVLIWLACRRAARWRATGDNIRLSAAGLSWTDDQGTSGRLPRERIQAFRIGLDPDTVRAIPALTLLLAGGFESQPIELHAPATPARVRAFLADELGLAEEPMSDERCAAALRGWHLAALDSAPQTAEKTVLLCSLVEPAAQPSGSWLLARIPRCGDVHYVPSSGLYRLVRQGASQVELARLDDLLAYVRDQVLAGAQEDVEQLVAQLQQEQCRRDRAALARDVRRAGFFVEIDDQGRWRFVGPRGGLLSLCEKLEEAADRLKPAPVGAKPLSLRIGGSTMGISIQLGEQEQIDDGTICGTPPSLRRLAERIRRRLVSAAVDSEVALCTSDDPQRAVLFRFDVKRDDYDPASGLDPTPSPGA